MKNLLSCLIVCLFVLPVHAQYAGGTGEPNDPYQICTAEQMNAIGAEPNDWDRCFNLMADIDLSAFDGWAGRPAFNIIGTSYERPFAGVFDGLGHTIHTFTFRGGDAHGVGLFGFLGPLAEVRNLVVDDSDVQGGTYVGSLVGYSNGGIVRDCRVKGSVRASQYTGGLIGICIDAAVTERCHFQGGVSGSMVETGGLVGANSHSTISQCSAAGVVEGYQETGGIAGRQDANSVIQDSYSACIVSGKDRTTAGIVGRNDKSLVSRCYSKGPILGSVQAGGLVAWNVDGTVEASFWDIGGSGQTTSDGGTGKTGAPMQTARTFLEAGWDFLGETENGTEDTWWILEGRDYPHLWWEKVLGDDFEDGQAEPLWMVFEVDPDLVQIEEVNGRLEVYASAEAQNVDAFYVSQGWRLDVAHDFAFRVDYHFSKQGGGDGRLTIGLLPSVEMPVTRWAEFEVGCWDTGPFYLYELRDDYWVQEQTSPRSENDGTLYVSYSLEGDELYFSHTGYGKPNAWRTLTGLLAGRWASGPVYVILGGGSEGMAFDGADAWLDNFAVQAGAILE
ncbi:MAG: GLUG motif-containing protein [Phycisphaerales bacterium]